MTNPVKPDPPTHRVVVFDLKTEKIVMDSLVTVDKQILDQTVREAVNQDPDFGIEPKDKQKGLVAAWMAGVEVCPWDCDHCRG